MAVLNPFPARSRAAFRRARAGYTLVELMVAMTAGIFITIVVFAVSRDSSRLYQQETRLANATLAGVSGFERLASDLSRAGHLCTPNIEADPRVCNKPDATFPGGLQHLRAIAINSTGVSASGTEVATAGFTPQSIIITGAINVPEELHTRTVTPGANGAYIVSINLGTAAAYRVGLYKGNTSNVTAATRLFIPNEVGKIIRLRRNGWEQYGVVQGVQGDGDKVELILATSPPFVVRTNDDSVQCGLRDLSGQMDLSIIDQVRYDIRSMTGNANYSELFKASGVAGSTSGLPYEAGRAELVRVELAPSGNEIAGTQEIVSEYAVDLQFDAWRATSAINSAIVNQPASGLVDTFASTQLLRSIHARVSVRSREADRDHDVAGGGGATNRNIFRMPLSMPDGTTTYARVRTFQSDIPLRNLENSNW